MPSMDPQTDIEHIVCWPANICVPHTFLPEVYIILELGICTIFRFVIFPEFQISRTSILPGIQKFGILEIW